MNLEKTREEKEKFERSLRETKEEFTQKSSSNDLKTEFVHFWEGVEDVRGKRRRATGRRKRRKVWRF